jgi:succinyl-diaminopimelate desuccinylase
MSIDFDKISKRIDASEAEMVDFQTMITAIPALSPDNGGEGEAEKAECIEEYLKSCGITDIIHVDAPDNRVPGGVRPNIIATIPGKSKRSLWLMAHTDVVPTGDRKLWATDPWKIVQKDGKLYGRGAEDNHQGLTSSVFMAKAFVEEGIVPEFTIKLLICADEESGSTYGLEYILDSRPELFSKDDIVVVPDAGQHDSCMIEVAEKFMLWLRFEVYGKQCHASMPQDGVNAARAGSYLMLALSKLYQHFNAKDSVFVPEISTFEPTRRKENVPNINTIPGDEIFYMDCRVLPCYTVKEVFEKIREICDEVEKDSNVQIEVFQEKLVESAPATPSDAPVVNMLKNAVKAVYDKDAQPMGLGGGTVAACFRKRNLNAAVWATIDQMAHQPNEYCKIKNLIGDAKVFSYIALSEK